MSNAAPRKVSGAPAGLDSFVVISLRGTFGFGQTEAEHVARKHALTRDNLKLWETFLEFKKADGKTQNPKAYTASLMRQYAVPPGSAPRPDGTPKAAANPRTRELQDLARRGAWWVGVKGTRWDYQEHGLWCKAQSMLVPYSNIPADLVERLITEAKVGEAGK